jgi:hypothetical protein
MFVKGDLVLPVDRIKREEWLEGLFHPAVIWDDYYDGYGDFHGIMLSSSGRYHDNIPMKEQHFELGYDKGYHNSHFVNRVFIKFEEWGPFHKVGRLTDEGISFIENNILQQDAEPFADYHFWQLHNKR